MLEALSAVVLIFLMVVPVVNILVGFVAGGMLYGFWGSTLAGVFAIIYTGFFLHDR